LSSPIRRLLLRGLIVAGGLFVVLAVVTTVVYVALRAGLPTPDTIAAFRAPAATRILDCQGRVISEYFQEKRRPVPLETIPACLREVVVAVEDRRFFHHWGIDLLRIPGAFLGALRRGDVKGTSTITQQLSRCIFLTHERNLGRKLREMVLAVEMERHYSKLEILEMYFNQVWFGGPVYGVGSAAERYFGKHVSRLDPVECATLGAMIANPAAYSPHAHPERLLQRRNFFLGRLCRLGRLTRAECDSARLLPLGITPLRGPQNEAPYFIEDVRRYLIDRYGYDFVYRSGATIHTTLDLDVQAAATQALLTWVDTLEKNYALRPTKAAYDEQSRTDTTPPPPDYIQCALVCLDARTGAVRAMVGGRNFAHSEYNRATQARRQAGSAFKPFVYVAAIDNGMTPADIENDSSIIIPIPGQPDYVPHNYDDKMLGPMTLRRALALSRNLVAVRLTQRVGPELVARYASTMGITERLPPYYSLALGSVEVTLLELTSAFNTLANSGVRTEPYTVVRVEDNRGQVLEENRPALRSAVRPATAYVVTSMLQSVVDEGTATVIRSLGYRGPAAGKTGTTDDYADACFVGYNPRYCCGVWLGFDRRRTIFRGATGGTVAAPAWAGLMKGIGADTVAAFSAPPDVVTAPICEESGQLATPACPRVRYEAFISGTAPTRNCGLHGSR